MSTEDRIREQIEGITADLASHLNEELSPDLVRLLHEHGATLDTIEQVRVLPDQRRGFVNVRLAIEVTD
jgi:hypothetical protein